MERLTYVARCLIVIDAIRLAHDRGRVHRGVLAKRDRYSRELPAVRAVTLEVAARDQRCARPRRSHPVNRVLAMAAAGFTRALTVARSAHHRTAHPGETDRGKACDRVRKARVDDHGSPLNAACGETPMRPSLVVATQIQPEDRGELIAVGADRRAETHDETIELLALQPAVVQRAEDGLGGEVDRTAHQPPSKFRIADAGDCGLVLQIPVRHVRSYGLLNAITPARIQGE